MLNNKFYFKMYTSQCLFNQTIELDFEEIFGQRSAHSLAVGPVIAFPFISPLLLAITPALSSK